MNLLSQILEMAGLKDGRKTKTRVRVRGKNLKKTEGLTIKHANTNFFSKEIQSTKAVMWESALRSTVFNLTLGRAPK